MNPDADRDGGLANAAHLLWRAAARAPAHVAIRAADGAVTYAALRSRAGAFADALLLGGARRGDRVVIFVERGADAAAAYIGCWAAGTIAVVVNETARARQLEYVLRHAGARRLIASAEALDRLHRPLDGQVDLLNVDEVGPEADFYPASTDPDEPAQITYTSGSTGLPKGVLASHANVTAAIGTVCGYLGLTGGDRIASVLPFSSVYGANQLLCALHAGAELIVESSPVANAIADGLRENGATVLAGVPALWTQLLAAPAFRSQPIESLRILQNAGGHLPPTMGRLLREAQPQAALVLQYGMTEVFRSTYLPPEEFDRRPGSMGKAMPGTEILVVREDLTECGIDEVGELVHAGPTVTLGYWNDPERTDAVYRTHPAGVERGRAVFSGDMVRRDAEGFLYYVGRRDRMIKSLGFRVGPDEILDVLHASGEIEDGVVTSVPDERRGEAIVAVVVMAPSGDPSRLKQFIRLELPRHMHPARIEIRDFLPRMPNGKHDVLAVQRSFAAAPGPIAV